MGMDNLSNRRLLLLTERVEEVFVCNCTHSLASFEWRCFAAAVGAGAHGILITNDLELVCNAKRMYV